MRLWLCINNSIIHSIDKRNGITATHISPILENPERIAVSICGEVGILGVDSGTGAAVKINNDVEISTGVPLDVVVERVKRGCGETVRFGDGNGFSEEVFVLVVALEGDLDGGFAGLEDEEVVPGVWFDDGVDRGREGAQNFGFDSGVEFRFGAEEGAAEGVGAPYVHVDAEGDAVVGYGGVGGNILEVEESVGEGGLGVPDAVQGEGEVDDAGRSSAGLEVEGGDDTEGLGCTANCPENFGILAGSCLD